MRQTTQITIEHSVVTSDRSYEQVIEALEAQLGLRADWENIAREAISTNASWEQAVQIVEQQLGTSGFTILRGRFITRNPPTDELKPVWENG